ncbi:butyrophilin subfamily 3 member A1-like isoform X2 [Alosa alosa]|uniref:butyrophilin subfamily 3 member A1-like isoform X2 n=1 Tax=Alosa alosa TaxID=278164 RepID=UPI0020154B8F|nr:butyrophilin subfamily 3 member A1-like isoform X2 [Alosa alosa]
MSHSKHKTFSVSQSCQTVVIYVPKKQETRQTCSSQPFLKPKLSLLKVLQECKVILQNHVLKYKHFQLIDVSSLDESKVILKGLAIDLNGVKELIKLSALKNDEGENGGRRLKHAEEVKQSEMQDNIAVSGEIHNSDWRSVVISKVKVTLDPKTANPSLRVSNDRRRVRSFTFEESKETQHAWSQRALHKYDGWFCIQGAEGFSSGQHYWEVGVRRSCDWRIGVLKESAPKHGFTKLTTSTGYWTLRLQLGSLVALTDPVTKLNQSSPTRVGVYLDVERKQVRFFDVQKKKRRHIYTFHADFSNDEKIYPVFGTVDTDRELVII